MSAIEATESSPNLKANGSEPPATAVAIDAPGSEEPVQISGLEKEKQRMALAPTFDRLIDANLQLTLAVGRLVRTSYVLLAVYAVSVGLLWYRR